MFATDDVFISRIVMLLRRFPVFPMFGNGETRLQPVLAEYAAEAVARI
jgi:NADH dehydrogenase